MPLDPSIILANADPARQYDPVASMGKAVSLKNAMQQGQLQNLQIQQQNQALQDSADFRTQYGVSPGVAQAAQKMQLGNLESVKAKHEAAKAELEAAKEFRDQQYSIYSQADPTNWPQVKAAAQANAANFAQKTGKPMPTTSNDEEVFDPAKQEQRLKGLLTFDNQLKLAAQKLAQEKAEADKWKPMETSTGFARFNSKDGTMEAVEGGFKPKPTAHALGAGGPVTTAGDPQEAMAKLSTNDQALVKQLAARQIMVGRAGGFQLNNPRNQALYALAVQLNPSLSVADNAAYQDFVKDLAKSSPNSAGGRVDSGNRMLGHAGDLVDALEKLNPGSGVTGRIGNVLAYPAERAFGSSIGSVSFIKSKLLGEVNKLVTGGVPHAKELEEDIKNMPDTATKEQWGSVIKAIADVGLEQVTATEEKRNNFLGNLAPKTSLLSDKAQKKLGQIYKYAGVSAPQMAPPSGSGYTTTAQGNSGAPGSPKPGTVMDGYVFNGGDPKDPKSWKKVG